MHQRLKVAVNFDRIFNSKCKSLWKFVKLCCSLRNAIEDIVEVKQARCDVMRLGETEVKRCWS